MTDPEVGYFVVLRYIYGQERFGVTPGAVVVMANCGHRAYLSIGGMDVLATEQGQRYYVMCDMCLGIQDALDDPDADLRVPQAVVDDIYRSVGVAEGDQLMAWGKQKGFKVV
jgi:hypothetical protein